MRMMDDKERMHIQTVFLYATNEPILTSWNGSSIDPRTLEWGLLKASTSGVVRVSTRNTHPRRLVKVAGRSCEFEVDATSELQNSWERCFQVQGRRTIAVSIKATSLQQRPTPRLGRLDNQRYAPMWSERLYQDGSNMSGASVVRVCYRKFCRLLLEELRIQSMSSCGEGAIRHRLG
jgi:hypothetical protein